MKKFIFYIIAALSLAACNKQSEETVITNVDKGEIAFRLGGDVFEVGTKTVAITALSGVPKIWWEAKEGTTVKHAVCSLSVNSTTGAVSTGKFWPSTKPSSGYDYRVANVAFTTSTGVISAAENTTDILVGTATGVKSNSTEITLNHIFARTGTLTLNTQEGYTLSNVSWKIKSKSNDSGTKGSYTIGTGWGSAATTALTETALTSSSDMYLIPATYTVSVTYTLSKGGNNEYSKEFTKSADVTLVQGKINTITGTASGGDADEISFTVKIAEWGDKSHTVDFQ